MNLISSSIKMIIIIIIIIHLEKQNGSNFFNFKVIIAIAVKFLIERM